MEFPVLYLPAKDGKIYEWKIWTSNNVIYMEWGYLNQKKRRLVQLIKEGGYIGRSNESTPAEKAEQIANFKWNKQVQCGYQQDLNDVLIPKKDVDNGAG